MFEHPAFIVLEVPSAIANIVQQWRERYDPIVAAFPVEITLTGSSGVGTLASDQDPAEVSAILGDVARGLIPFTTQFTHIGRFPGTDIFYLAPAHPEKFVAVQKMLTATRLRFNPSPFPYTPHCTIRSAGKVSPEDEQALLALQAPSQAFTLDTLAVYELVNNRVCNLLYRAEASGNLPSPAG
jgi:2'-5' RNA ligase